MDLRFLPGLHCDFLRIVPNIGRIFTPVNGYIPTIQGQRFIALSDIKTFQAVPKKLVE